MTKFSSHMAEWMARGLSLQVKRIMPRGRVAHPLGREIVKRDIGRYFLQERTMQSTFISPAFLRR